MFSDDNGMKWEVNAMGFPGGSVVKTLLPVQETGFNPWSGKILQAEEQRNPWAMTTEPAH